LYRKNVMESLDICDDIIGRGRNVARKLSFSHINDGFAYVRYQLAQALSVGEFSLEIAGAPSERPWAQAEAVRNVRFHDQCLQQPAAVHGAVPRFERQRRHVSVSLPMDTFSRFWAMLVLAAPTRQAGRTTTSWIFLVRLRDGSPPAIDRRTIQAAGRCGYRCRTARLQSAA
jgi:hypothetical protein